MAKFRPRPGVGSTQGGVREGFFLQPRRGTVWPGAFCCGRAHGEPPDLAWAAAGAGDMCCFLKSFVRFGLRGLVAWRPPYRHYTSDGPSGVVRFSAMSSAALAGVWCGFLRRRVLDLGCPHKRGPRWPGLLSGVLAWEEKCYLFGPSLDRA